MYYSIDMIAGSGNGRELRPGVSVYPGGCVEGRGVGCVA